MKPYVRNNWRKDYFGKTGVYLEVFTIAGSWQKKDTVKYASITILNFEIGIDFKRAKK